MTVIIWQCEVISLTGISDDYWGKKEGMISVIGQTTDADAAAKDNCS